MTSLKEGVCQLWIAAGAAKSVVMRAKCHNMVKKQAFETSFFAMISSNAKRNDESKSRRTEDEKLRGARKKITTPKKPKHAATTTLGCKASLRKKLLTGKRNNVCVSESTVTVGRGISLREYMKRPRANDPTPPRRICRPS